jgi:hypothetical protein
MCDVLLFYAFFSMSVLMIAVEDPALRVPALRKRFAARSLYSFESKARLCSSIIAWHNAEHTCSAL